MKLLIKVNCLDENVNWVDHLVVELSEERQREILKQRELFQMVASKSPDLSMMLFWGIPGEFYQGCIEDEEDGGNFTKEQVATYENDEFLVLPEDFEDEDQTPIRTDLDCTVITADGFYFRAICKHTDVYVESVELKYETMMRLTDTC